MSQEQAEQIKEHAQEIFGTLVESVGHNHWDWNPIAVKALEAAEAFFKMYEQRYKPQTGTPTDPKAPGSPEETTPPPPQSSPDAATATGPAPEPAPPQPPAAEQPQPAPPAGQ